MGNASASLPVDGVSSTAAGKCSATEDGTPGAPAYWMVDLGVSTEIEGLIISSAIAVSDLQISIGDKNSATGNTPCSQGQQIAATTPVVRNCSAA